MLLLIKKWVYMWFIFISRVYLHNSIVTSGNQFASKLVGNLYTHVFILIIHQSPLLRCLTAVNFTGLFLVTIRLFEIVGTRWSDILTVCSRLPCYFFDFYWTVGTGFKIPKFYFLTNAFRYIKLIWWISYFKHGSLNKL